MTRVLVLLIECCILGLLLGCATTATVKMESKLQDGCTCKCTVTGSTEADK